MQIGAVNRHKPHDVYGSKACGAVQPSRSVVRRPALLHKAHQNKSLAEMFIFSTQSEDGDAPLPANTHGTRTIRITHCNSLHSVSRAQHTKFHPAG